MSKEKKKSESNKSNNKKEKDTKNQKVTETNTKSKDTKKNKNEKKFEKKIIEEAIIENEELEMDSDLELDDSLTEESFDNEDLEFEEDFNEDIEEEFDEDIDEDIEEDFDEDLEFEEDFDTDEEEIVEDFDTDEELIEEEITEIIEEPKPKKESKKSKETKKTEKKSKENKKEEKVSKENIKKIEKIAKDKKKKNSKQSSKLGDLGNFLEDHRNIISGFIAGILLTILVVIIIWPERIATLEDGTQPVVKVAGKTYTADDLYEKMKSHYSVSQLLDQIDNDILTKKYKENEEMLKEVKSNAEYYLNMYEQYYGYSEEEFLSANGFASYDDYLEYLKLDYRRKKYLDEYVKSSLTDDEIKKYYDENVYGDINCQHVLVEISEDEKEGLNETDAKKLAEKIIDKINDGTSWDDIKKEYKDQITFEDLGYQSWDSDLEESFKTALRNMDNNSYSEEPVKTSYGYHVIYRLDQKDAPTLKKTKETIIKNLITEKEEDDKNLLYKALISLREEKNIKFSDTDMKAKYEAYVKEYK